MEEINMKKFLSLFTLLMIGSTTWTSEQTQLNAQEEVENDNTCSICWEDYNDDTLGVTTCGHTFHYKCLQKQPHTCPECKTQKIRFYKTNTLLAAAYGNNTPLLRRLITKRIPLNLFDQEESHTALMIAAMKNYIEIAQELINAGANLNQQDRKGNTALSLALQHNNQEIAQKLINAGADQQISRPEDQQKTESTDQQQENPQKNISAQDECCICYESKNDTSTTNCGHTFCTSCIQKWISQPKMKLTREDVSCQQRHGMAQSNSLHCPICKQKLTSTFQGPALLNAALMDDITLLDRLITSNTDLNIKNSRGFTALMLTTGGHLDKQVKPAFTKALINAGADINSQNEDGNTALIFASINEHSNIVEELLRANANPDLQNKNGYTALMLAVQNNNYQTARALVQFGADVNLQNKNGKNAFNIAKKSTPIAQMVNPENTQYWFNAIIDNNKISVNRFIQNRINVNLQYPPRLNGHTGLILAAKGNNTEMIHLLLNSGANPDLQNTDGYTALMIATEKNNFEIVQLLLNAHADVNLQNKYGETALTISASLHNPKITQTLIAAGANLDPQKPGATALIIAASHNQYETAQALIKAGANLDQQDRYGNTVLMIIMNNHTCEFDRGVLDTVQALLAAGANLNLQDDQGKTALMKAAEKTFTHIAKKLITAGADLTIKDNCGKTALDFARTRSYNNSIVILIAERMQLLAGEQGMCSLQ